MQIPTPHIQAEQGAFARTVLMPGDPLRATFIAKQYLQETVQVNEIRGIAGYTGKYRGQAISVMASGMGMPSMGIYSYELFHGYGVDNIIRVGSAGAILQSLHVRDIILAQGACTNSAYAGQYRLPGSFAPIADFALLRAAAQVMEDKGLRPIVGNVLSSDTFYDDDAESLAQWQKMGVLAVEMECAALYCNAARAGKRALGICTISDNPVTGEACTAQEREQTFTDMMEIALEAALRLEKGSDCQ